MRLVFLSTLRWRLQIFLNFTLHFALTQGHDVLKPPTFIIEIHPSLNFIPVPLSGPRVPNHDAGFLRRNSWKGNRSRTELWSPQYLKWPFMAYQWGLLSSYESWDDPPRNPKIWKGMKMLALLRMCGHFFGVVSFHVTWIQSSCKRDSEKAWIGDLLWSQVESPG